MGSTLAAIITLLGLLGWHLRTRRHPSWSVSADARFYIYSGYPLVAIAVFWLTKATTGTDWEWAIGNVWAFIAMVMFVRGFNALSVAAADRHSASHAIESIDETHQTNGAQAPRTD